MPTIITHAVVGAGLATLTQRDIPKIRLVSVLAVVAVLPDLDVVGFHLGIAYGDALGHRGFTHSLLFALLVAIAVPPMMFRQNKNAWLPIALLAFVATASHGVLDAFTDAGLGVGFLIPFDDSRYFAWWRPLETSPLSISRFLSARGVSILLNELAYILLPFGSFVLGWVLLRWIANRDGD